MDVDMEERTRRKFANEEKALLQETGELVGKKTKLKILEELASRLLEQKMCRKSKESKRKSMELQRENIAYWTINNLVNPGKTRTREPQHVLLQKAIDQLKADEESDNDDLRNGAGQGMPAAGADGGLPPAANGAGLQGAQGMPAAGADGLPLAAGADLQGAQGMPALEKSLCRFAARN